MRPTVTVEPSQRWNRATRATPYAPDPRNAPNGTYDGPLCAAWGRGQAAIVDATSITTMANAARSGGSGQNGMGLFRRPPNGRPAEWISAARMRIVCPWAPIAKKASGRNRPRIYVRKVVVRRNPWEYA